MRIFLPLLRIFLTFTAFYCAQSSHTHVRYVQKLRSPWKLQNAEKSASDTKVVNASKKLQLHMKLLFSCWELLAKFISSEANEARILRLSNFFKVLKTVRKLCLVMTKQLEMIYYHFFKFQFCFNQHLKNFER